LVLYNKLVYHHHQEYHDVTYANWLMSCITKLNQDQWCGMFVGKYNISFQVLDYEPLRKVYCRLCGDYENEAKRMPEPDTR
jgi:hypothetical protein